MAGNFSICCEVQNFVREHQKKICNSAHVDEFAESLESAFGVLLHGSLDQVEPNLRLPYKEEFFKKHYTRFAEFLLRPPAIGFYSNLNSDQKEKFEFFFLQENASESFLVLGHSLSRVTQTDHAKTVALLLEKFINSSKLSELFLEQSEISQDASLTPQNRHCSSDFLRGQIITLLVSMPERVANKLKLSTKSLFSPNVFVTKVAAQIIEAMEAVHQRMTSASRDFSFKFLSELLGRLAMAGYGRRVFSILLPAFEKWMSISPLWSRICCSMITGVPDSTLEHVMESLLKEVNSPVILAKLLGDSILTNCRLKFLLMTKFLLLRYYSDPKILSNIVGYLSGCKRRHLLIETIKSLFDNWGNKSALKHTSYDQHAYISYALVHAVGYLNRKEQNDLKHELLAKLLTGVQGHLESPIEKVRQLGMVVAECVTTTLEPEGEKLTFEYSEDAESKLLKNLARGPKAEFGEKEYGGNVEDGRSKFMGKSIGVAVTKETTVKRFNQENGSDTDDDLVPYDLEEEDFEEQKSPRHLRDCIESLLESEKPEKTEAALKVVEKLVCVDPDDLSEVCVELVKILLHLQDKYSTENFLQLRDNAMVAIAIRCPVQVAGYLTEEFFGANYNIRQRLDMLDVLSATAQQLSEPVEITKEKTMPKKFPLPKTDDHVIVEMIPEWQRIIQERVEQKTKRFSKGQSKTLPKPVVNKFSQVAGSFFYPLMKNFDCKINTLDLLGDDSFVLGRLVYTLGILMHSARGTPGARTMGAALIEFTWALRYHHEPFIRQVLLFAQVMVFVSVPVALLFSDCGSELLEVHDWLKDLLLKDVNSEVRQTALQVLVVLEDAFKSEITSTTEG